MCSCPAPVFPSHITPGPFVSSPHRQRQQAGPLTSALSTLGPQHLEATRSELEVQYAPSASNKKGYTLQQLECL